VTRREGWTNPPSRCTHRTRSGGCGTRRGAAAAAAEQERLRRPRLPRVSEDEKRVAVVVKRVFLAVAGVAPAAAAAMGGEQDGCGASERMQIREAWVGPVCCELRHDLGCRLQLLFFSPLWMGRVME